MRDFSRAHVPQRAQETRGTPNARPHAHVHTYLLACIILEGQLNAAKGTANLGLDAFETF